MFYMIYSDNDRFDEGSQFLGGWTLGYFLSKNKQYLNIAYPEYMLRVIGKSVCESGIPDELEAYKSAYKIKYSNSTMDRFYIGNVTYTLVESEESMCGKNAKVITQIIFHAETHKNRWGWNFSTGPNDLDVTIDIGKRDKAWLWKYGFVIVQFPLTCSMCHPGPITMHQFFIVNDAPYGLGPTDQPYDWLGKDGLIT